MGLKAFIRKDDRLLIVRESDKYKSGGAWELPGGRIKESELNTALSEILQREIVEELGNAFKVRIGSVLHVWRRPTHPDGPVFLVGFDCYYESGDITVSEEHTETAWIQKSNIDEYLFADGFKEAIEKFFK